MSDAKMRGMTRKISLIVIAFILTISVIFQLGCSPQRSNRENEPRIEDDIEATQLDIATIRGAIMTYELLMGEYPSSIDDLAKKKVNDRGNLLDATDLTDRWGTKYSFKIEGDGDIEVRSAGPDMQMNTADDLFKIYLSKATQGQ